MSHIIILDADGNEIGREEHDPEAGLAAEEDHAPTIIRMDLDKVEALMKASKKKDGG